MEKVIKTKSGLFLKIINDKGAFVFSPFSGFNYAIHKDDFTEILNWLNDNTISNIDAIYKNVLGKGWLNPLECNANCSNFILPNRNKWKNDSLPHTILGINWFLTGKCNLDCLYCYASDLMRNHISEPTEKQIITTAKNILKYKPLFVVLTGGEPLLSPFLKTALEILSEHTGIIIDTNGLNLSDKKIKMFKKYNITVRISIDSERPKTNQIQRPYYNQNSSSSIYSINKIVENINLCLNNSLPFVVQTVVTQKNANELVAFGEKLYKLGTHYWRILRIQETESNKKGFSRLMTSNHSSKSKSYKTIDYNIEKILKTCKTKCTSLSVQVTHNRNHQRNSVILVSPEGKFYTESSFGQGKILIDEKHPFNPRTKHFFEKINLFEHVSRYLYLDD